jgi:uncharacterized membrane protein YfcA
MTVLVFSLLLLLGAFLAGFLGSMTGLGGGVILIPLLTLVFKVDIHYAIGAAVVASIATSSGSAAAYVRDGIANIRIGMFLEIATTTGAVVGVFLATMASPNLVAVIFGLVLIFSGLMSFRKKVSHIETQGSPLANTLRLNGTYPVEGVSVKYSVKNVVGGYIIMTIAGILSALLGIGSGALKVLAMDMVMRLPFKVSTTTSNFMIGVTAAASGVVYLQRGYIEPGIALPVVLGVLGGAMTGSKVLANVKVNSLRIVFGVIMLFMAMQMIYNGWHGNFK